MIFPLARLEVDMTLPRAFVGSLCPARVIRSVPARRFTLPLVNGLVTMVVQLVLARLLKPFNVIILEISKFVSVRLREMIVI
jgi:hypothetical protein